MGSPAVRASLPEAMRTLARFLGRMVLALGWLAFLALAGLFLAEKTGLLTHLARSLIAERAGPAGEDLQIDHLSLSWFDSRVHLYGVKLGEDGDAVLFEEADLEIDAFRGGGLRVADVEVRGGHVRLSPKLFERVQSMAARFPPRAPGERHTAAVPSVTIRGLELDLDTERLGRLPLGQVDATFRSTSAGPSVLRGRLIPSLSSTPGGPGEIYLAGQEFEPGAFEVLASAAGVPLSTDYLPQGTVLDGLRPFAPKGLLALQAFGRIFLDGRLPPRGRAHVALTEGRILAAGGKQSIEGVSLDLETTYAPKSSEDLWNLAAWTARARSSGRWREVPFEAVARLADAAEPGRLVSCQLHVPHLPCAHEMIDLFGDRPSDESLWQALEPRGEVELWASLACPRDWLPGEPLGEKLAAAFEIAFSGKAGLTYHGFPSRATGERDQGFPLPVDGLKGSVVYAFDAKRLRPVMLGIVDVSGSPGQGFLRATGRVTSHPVNAPLYLPGHGYVELDLRVQAGGVPVDDRLRSALVGLSGAVPPADTWEPFHPSGGEIAADLRVVRTVDMDYAATHLELDLQDVSLSFGDPPIPVSRARGRLEFLSDGRSERGLGAEMQGSLRTASDVRLSLRFQTDPSAPAPPGGKLRLDEMAFLSIRAGRISLTGDDKKILVTQFPSIGAALDLAAPRGFADVAYTRVRTAEGAPASTTAEVTSREAELLPRDLRVPASAVRGRVLVTALEEHPDGEVRTETRLAPLIGALSGDAQVAVTARFPEGKLHLHGAGIDLTNKSLLGALGEAIRSPGQVQGADLTALSVEGALDFTGEIALADDPAKASQTYWLFLRENSLQTSKSFRLDRLRGIVELRVRDRVLLGHQIEASLADTPLDLTELRIATTAEGFELTTRIPHVENLPLDRDHLRPFVDEKTLDALLGPLGWRGRIDLEDGRVRITGPRQGDTRLEFSGKVTPSDMQVQLGLPFSIRSASATVEELIYEGGRVRAVCRIEDLYGTIADRDLAKASLLITYVEPRLSIESLRGELEGGTIRPLGEGAERGGTAFSIDLEEPFPFQLALDLRGVQLAGLSRGLFDTSFATRGKLDCRLRLTGDTRKVLEIQGSGSIQMSESRLWSVPVFRALFSQLGIDDQAVFDRMAANVRVRNGVIWTDDISVHSPILQLVGNGWVDFDGGLKEDLQVRYGLIDRLGPLTRILYAIQKELLSVAIRGDLARPKVILKNPWTRVYAQADRYRSLPLPGFSPLPPRF
jgi:hypothetical protein